MKFLERDSGLSSWQGISVHGLIIVSPSLNKVDENMDAWKLYVKKEGSYRANKLHRGLLDLELIY